jgi:hypothetical protein
MGVSLWCVRTFIVDKFEEGAFSALQTQPKRLDARVRRYTGLGFKYG